VARVSDATPDTQDWRTTVDLGDERHRARFMSALETRRLVREARHRVGARVIVTHDGPRLFLYTDGEQAARAVEEIVLDLLAEHGLQGTTAVMRWHPIEERWEDAAHPLPGTPQQEAAEVAQREADDRELSRRQGYPEWDVRLVFQTRGEALDAAARLEAEGIVVARGGNAMIAGADTEKDARALADRLRAEVRDATTIAVEVNRAEAWTEAHPFAFLGGIAN
jgi:hypothetical protein